MIELPTPNKVQAFLASNNAASIAASQNSQNQVILIILVIFVIVGVVAISGIFIGYVKTNKDKLQKDWKNLRCKPQYMPFASIIGPKGTSFGKNFSNCMSSFFEDSFNHYIAPYLKMITSLTGIVAGLSNSVQRIREMLTAIRDNLEDYARTMVLRMKMAYLRIMNLFRILQAFFSKTAATFIAIGNIFKYMYYIGASVWNGPAGWFFRFFLGALDGDCCFDEDTLIEMENGFYKKIKDIKIGDKLKKGGQVLGNFEFIPLTPMYLYKNIIVSGTHRVYSKEYNQFIPISEMKEATLLSNYNKNTIYCLNTESRRIEINDEVFMDYMDCMNMDEERDVNSKIYKKLNGFAKRDNYYPSGFGGISGNVLVKMQNGEWKSLKRIEVGDMLFGGKKVYGLVEVETLGGELNDEIMLAESQLIKNQNNYDFFGKKDKYIILNQIFCETHSFIIKIGNNEMEVRDYEQIELD